MKEKTKVLILLTTLIIEIALKVLIAALVIKALFYLAIDAPRDQVKGCAKYKQTTSDSTTTK